MEKKEEILENFKTAISSTVRSISDKENIEVIFGTKKSKNDKKTIFLPKIEKIKEEVTVYNLRVTSSAMNYFADSYLVHNASLCDECDAKNNKL